MKLFLLLLAAMVRLQNARSYSYGSCPAGAGLLLGGSSVALSLGFARRQVEAEDR